MFCGKCGTQFPDDAAFCPNCGSPAPSAARPSTPPPAPPVGASAPAGAPMGGRPAAPTANKNKIIGIGAVAVVAVLLIVLLMNLFGGRSLKKTVGLCVDGMMKADASKILDAVPKKLLDEELESMGYDTKKEAINDLSEQLENTLDYLDDMYGSKWSYSYEIVDEDGYSTQELKDLNERYEDYDLKVSDAKRVEVEITIKDKDGEELTTQSNSFTLIKSGRSWYIGDF